MGAAAAGEYEDAGVGPFEGFEVCGELAFSQRMGQAFLILLEIPFKGFRVNVGPAESVAAVGRIAEVIDFVPGLSDARDDFRIVLVPPAGGDTISTRDVYNLATKTILGSKHSQSGRCA